MRRPSPALPLLAVLSLSACAPEGPSGFVTYNLVPSSDCTYSPESGTKQFYPIGLYDVSPGGPRGGNACSKPYIVNLLVNSFLRPNADPMLGRAEPNILQLHSAEVKLMDIQNRTIQFTGGDSNLPNPFLVRTNNSLQPASGSQPSMAVASVEVIPVDYAAQLNGDMFVGAQIMAEIQIFGTTTGDVDIEFKPFVYPIEICDGCLTYCLAPLGDADIDPDDLIGDDCPDNSGRDGRVCIDPDC
jgi:hypothetical protein